MEEVSPTQLAAEIKEKRELLQSVAGDKPEQLRTAHVYQLSTELDKLILQYQRKVAKLPNFFSQGKTS